MASIDGITCYLKSTQDPLRKINLPHQTLVVIGRNKESGITDLHISKNHLECTADYVNKDVLLRTVGKAHSGCNGYALLRNESYSLKHKDRIEVRLGFHEYEIVFEQDDFEPKEKRPKAECSNSSSLSEGSWEEIDKKLLIFTSKSCEPHSLIASFDLDGTLIKTKSGARFPKSPTDWTFNLPSIPNKLKELHLNKHKIVIFTNQSGLKNDASKTRDFKAKVESVVNSLGIPVQVFISTTISIYRKPATGMWNALCDIKNEGVDVDHKNSFYVGDAAGREKNWAPKRKKDHSICDRLFALNLGLKFYTPEEYFQRSSAARFIMPEFDPRNLTNDNLPDITTTTQEVVIMVGIQGSGKSHFAKNHLIPKGYIHVNRDKLGSREKCLKVLEDSIKKELNVVVDNVNIDKESRSKFIELARKYGIKCRCFLMDLTHSHAKHNNRFRQFTDKTHSEINEIIINSTRKKYQEPELSEGFSEIVKIPFFPNFADSHQEDLYKKFLLES